jgi:hypothetical protein
VGTWTATTDYPIDVLGSESCVVSSGQVYCVGGVTATDLPTKAVYYAPLSASGVGTWTSTTDYPIEIEAQACAVSLGYVYCVGGVADAVGVTNAVYFAPVSPSGVGPWTATTNYPTNIYRHSCVISSGYIYCVSGNTGGSTFPLFGSTNAVYYAPISQPPGCRESDGNGDFQGQQKGNFNFDNDGCIDGDRDQVSSTNCGDGRDFQSTQITTTTFDAVAHTVTITGLGTHGGVTVTFVFVAVETGPTTPGWVSFSLSDGYTNAGPLVSGIILLH